MNQPNITVESAFETLRSALEHVLEIAWTNADDAVQLKDSEGVQQALDRTRLLDNLLQRLAVFRAEFEDCIELPIEPVASVSSRPAVSSAIKYIAHRSRVHGLNITPREEYYRPILETLVELGGRAKPVAVLDRVGEKMQHRLTEDDRALLPEGGSIRWRNHAQWVRLDMVKEGLLRHSSPYGIWEISDEGHAWLEKRYS